MNQNHCITTPTGTGWCPGYDPIDTGTPPPCYTRDCSKCMYRYSCKNAVITDSGYWTTTSCTQGGITRDRFENTNGKIRVRFV